MAAEDSGNSPAPASSPILPHYPDLILAAIEALDSKYGANKSKISKQIEASYSNLPAAHKTLLSHHLNKMRASGQLDFIKNNYVKHDPTSPPPRGRGRPRKSQDPLNPASPEASPSVSGRKRGRPSKLNTDTAAAPTPAPATGEEQSPDLKTNDDSTPSPAPATGEKKGRGRPPKVKTGDAVASEPATGEKKGRGRPPKVKTGVSPAPESASEPASGAKRGRGRPPKVKEPAPVEA